MNSDVSRKYIKSINSNYKGRNTITTISNSEQILNRGSSGNMQNNSLIGISLSSQIKAARRKFERLRRNGMKPI